MGTLTEFTFGTAAGWDGRRQFFPSGRRIAESSAFLVRAS